MDVRRPFVTPFLVVVVLLGACSGRHGPSTAEQPEGSGGVARAEGVSTDLGPLPFDELLGLGLDPAELAKRWAIWSDGYPPAMTTCMRQRGYVEFVEPTEPIPTIEELEVGGRIAPASAGLREHGYGIAGNARLQIDNATTDRSVAAGTPEGPPAWLSALSTEAHRAYEADHRACREGAASAFPHPRGGLAAGQGLDAFIELSELRRSFDVAPEVQTLWGAWATCMRGHGWSAGRRTDLIDELNATADPLLLRLEGGRRGASGVLGVDDPVIVEARRTLETLRVLEHEMVTDDLACAASMDLDRREHQARYRLQSAYLAAHRDEVRRLVAATGLAP